MDVIMEPVVDVDYPGASADGYSARTLAEYILSIPDIQLVTFEPYGHMGATLVDAVFQAGINYRFSVIPRVRNLQHQYPNATTTSAFARVLAQSDPHGLLDWRGERKITTLLTLTELLVDEGVETEDDLLAFLDRPGSRELVTAIRGIADKTFQYLRFLAGAEDAVAVDRHMWRTLKAAGVLTSSFDEARGLYVRAAALLGVTPAVLEYSVFLWGSSGGRKRR